MEEQRKEWLRRLEPRQLADDANRGFVTLAEVLMRVITWQRPFVESARRERELACGEDPFADPPSEEPGCRLEGAGLSWTDLPESFDQLRRRIERLARECVDYVDGPCPAEPPPISGTEMDAAVERHLRELFHGNALRRLAAIDWLREKRCFQAITTLEGVLSIEESDEVRVEIERALEALYAADPGRRR